MKKTAAAMPLFAKKAAFLLVFICFLIENAKTQNQDLPETQAKKFGLRPDFDLAEWLEKGQTDGSERLELSKIERTDLQHLAIFSTEKIDAFFEHRQKLGPFESIFELQSIEGWQSEDIEKLLPFLKKTANEKPFCLTFKKLFSRGGNEFLMRYGLVRDTTKWAEKNFLGSNEALFFRFRKRIDNRLSLGFAVEKDAGEQLGGPKNRAAFDHFTGHFFIKNPRKRIKTLALGDFRVGLGQGLLLSSGLGATKSRDVLDIKTSGQNLRPKTTAMEDFFQRGAAAEFAFSKKWAAGIFASSIRRDAVLTDTFLNETTAFSSFSTGGVHRNKREIQNEKTLKEQLAGGFLGFEKSTFHVRLNAVAVRWDRPFEPPIRADLIFQNRANSLIMSSLDHSKTWRGLHFFGENAVGSSGGFALLNGVIVPISRRSTASFLHRNFSKKFVSPHGRAFSENGEPRNERGFFAGFETRPTSRLRLDFYADRWRDAWLTFSEKSLGGGREFLAAAEFSVRKKWTASARFRAEAKGADRFVFSKNWGRRSLQFRFDQRLSPQVKWSSRADFTSALSAEKVSKKGFLLLQQLDFESKSGKIQLSTRWAIFETDGFASRIFAHERHLTESQFVPFFYGRGTRFLISTGWRPTAKWSLEGFVGRTKATNPTRQALDFKAQVRRFF